MAILLETDSGTNANITSELAIGSYTASGAKMVLAQIRLSSLNGAAATITAKLQQTSAADALIGTRDATATAKDTATNTVWSGRALGPIYLADGEKAICKVTSTNASDTAAAWSVEWLDAQESNAPTAATIKTTVEAEGSSLAQILADTNELQTNQGNWETADISDLPTNSELATALEGVTIDTTDLAKEATLEAIKGAGWATETLKAIYENVPDIDLSDVALEATVDAVQADLTKVKAAVYDSAPMGSDGYIVLSNGTRVLVSAAGRATTES